MTKTEYEAIRSLYIKLMNKKNRTEVEEAKYLYIDKIMTYINLRAEAKRMGNKNPDDNFVIKRAKEHMESAQKRLAEVTEKSKQAELNNEKD